MHAHVRMVRTRLLVYVEVYYDGKQVSYTCRRYCCVRCPCCELLNPLLRNQVGKRRGQSAVFNPSRTKGSEVTQLHESRSGIQTRQTLDSRQRCAKDSAKSPACPMRPGPCAFESAWRVSALMCFRTMTERTERADTTSPSRLDFC